MLATLVTGGLSACTQGGQPIGQSSATPPVSGSSIASASPTTAPQPPPLGPRGYGASSLGMTKAEALATGVTAMTATGEGKCGGQGDGYLADSPNTDGEAIAGRLFFSAATGRLVAIYAFPGLKTPQGIGLGSSYEELHAAYPSWTPIDPSGIDGRGGIPVPGNPDAHYRIVVTDRMIAEISLDSNKQDCYE